MSWQGSTCWPHYGNKRISCDTNAPKHRCRGFSGYPAFSFWKVSYRVHPKAWIRADVATHAAHLKPTPPLRVSRAPAPVQPQAMEPQEREAAEMQRKERVSQAPAPEQPKEMEAAEMQRRESEWMAKDWTWVARALNVWWFDGLQGFLNFNSYDLEFNSRIWLDVHTPCTTKHTFLAIGRRPKSFVQQRLSAEPPCWMQAIPLTRWDPHVIRCWKGLKFATRSC